MGNAKSAKFYKFVLSIILASIMLCLFFPNVYAEIITPQSNQYLEFRIVSVEPVAGKDRQVIAELWAYNMEFKSIELNLVYDSSKLIPSTLVLDDPEDSGNNNFIYQPDDETAFTDKWYYADDRTFWKIDDLDDDMEVWFKKHIPSALQYIFNIPFPWNYTSQYVETHTNSEGDEYASIIAGNDGVLLGNFSYRLFNGEISATTFGLQPVGTLTTGIRIVIDDVDEYIGPIDPTYKERNIQNAICCRI